MTAYDLAYHFDGEVKLSDVKYATIFATTFNEAKERWLKTEPKAIIIEEMCRDLRKDLK